ncbi:MAG: hypothetical protein ABIQ70_13840, partial [Dokdonella sp.]
GRGFQTSSFNPGAFVVANLLSVIFLTLAVYVVVLNWACVIASYRFWRGGVKRHVSPMFALAQILVLAAAIASKQAPVAWLAHWSFWLVAFADAALLQMLCFPILLLRRRGRAQP